ncbi:MAG: hypothetical protein JO170_23585 [Verrucomicrobia bacterium]|nr:hypothetical protein [Verrucomicrobiota bacterium]
MSSYSLFAFLPIRLIYVGEQLAFCPYEAWMLAKVMTTLSSALLLETKLQQPEKM